MQGKLDYRNTNIAYVKIVDKGRQHHAEPDGREPGRQEQDDLFPKASSVYCANSCMLTAGRQLLLKVSRVVGDQRPSVIPARSGPASKVKHGVSALLTQQQLGS